MAESPDIIDTCKFNRATRPNKHLYLVKNASEIFEMKVNPNSPHLEHVLYTLGYTIDEIMPITKKNFMSMYPDADIQYLEDKYDRAMKKVATRFNEVIMEREKYLRD